MEARGVIKGFLESRWGSGTSSGVRRSGSVDLHWALSHEGQGAILAAARWRGGLLETTSDY